MHKKCTRFESFPQFFWLARVLSLVLVRPRRGLPVLELNSLSFTLQFPGTNVTFSPVRPHQGAAWAICPIGVKQDAL